MDPVEFVILLAAGIVIGAYATGVGAGGGFLFTPLLLWRYESAEPAEVAMASVLLVVASSGLATVRLVRAGRLDVRAVAMVAIVTTPAGVLGAFGTSQLPRDVFAAGFAVLIALIAAYVIWRPAGDAGSLGRRGWRRMIRDRSGDRYLYWIPSAARCSPPASPPRSPPSPGSAAAPSSASSPSGSCACRSGSRSCLSRDRGDDRGRRGHLPHRLEQLGRAPARCPARC